MPPERTVKSTDRCQLHPGAPAVARCETCGRRLCLTCAVPVRGRVFGPECLAEALGGEGGGEPPPDVEPGDRTRQWIAGIAFAVASAASVLPWNRFGAGAGWFGAWGRPRWSMLAAVAAVTGLVLWAIRRRLPSMQGRVWDAALGVLAAVVAVGGLLAGLRPPFASRAWFAPWIAAAAGLLALAACLPALGRQLGRDTRRS